MKGRSVGFVLAASALLGALLCSPTLVAPSIAAAQSACGPASQPCTWNFSASASSAGGADVYAAQAAGRGGAGVLVAVVDSWVDAAHPAFGGRVVDQVDCVGATDSNGNPSPSACADHRYAPDSCVHGTHVAGTIASSNFGVAPEASILSVQVLSADSNGGCSGVPSDVAAGIVYAAQRGARVINLSIGDLLPGLMQDQNITDAVHQAASAGALVVFASGNNGSPFTDSYGSDAILVAATGPSGQLAGYSNSGNMAAPGGDDGTSCTAVVACFSGNGCTASTCVLSTLPHTMYNPPYGLLEGTSMAAPHVSGAAALLFAENPGRSRDDVMHALEATARPVSGAGSGLLDAGAALALEPPPAGTPPPSHVTPPPTSFGSGRSIRASGAAATSAPVTAGSSGSPTTGAPSTTTTPSTASPQSPAAVPFDAATSTRKSAAGAQGGGKSNDASSVAAVGAVAALLLLISGAGTGLIALRRRA